MTIPQDITDYEKALSDSDKTICEVLRETLDTHLSEATSKVWHGHPVWFIEKNPIVGYSKEKK
jgi:uncharacterized protein YdhG (YjbR/CyaY superfamily)